MLTVMFASCPPNLHLNLKDAVYAAFLLLELKLECFQICQIMNCHVPLLPNDIWTITSRASCDAKKDNVQEKKDAKKCLIQHAKA